MTSNKKPQTLHSLSDLQKATGMDIPNATSSQQPKKKIISFKKPYLDTPPDTTNNGNQPNIGWMFYKDYFTKVKFEYVTGEKSVEKFNTERIKEKNREIIEETKWVDIKDGLGIPRQVIELKVTYPGLVSGVGIAHEAGVEGEFKLGMHFDYTYGQPIIHGSSVKGLLRSVFPKEGKNKKGEDKDRHYAAKIHFFKNSTLKTKLENKNDEETITFIRIIEKEIFDGIRDGKPISIYHRDTFFDAILKEPDQGKRILERDSITPHGTNPLKNPIPLPFLKINSDCTLQFRFDVKDGRVLDVNEKKELFSEILRTLGIGAKTNVGYGQFD